MEFNLKDHLVLLVLAGSRSYGLHTDESDVDIKGVCMPPVDLYRLGLHEFNQVERKEGKGEEILALTNLLTPEEQEICTRLPLEGVVYDLKKFVGLCLTANPNILETLFCEEADVRFCTPAGRLLREHRRLFLTKKVAHAYPGYAFSQMERIKTHRGWLLSPPEREPKREDFGLDPDHGEISLDEQNTYLWVLVKILEGKLAASKLSKSTKEELAQVGLFDTAQAGIPDEAWPVIQKITGAPKEFVRIMQKERQYRAARQHWKSYLGWQETRNPKRKVLEAKCGYDCKFALHIARLMIQGREILEQGTLTVRVPSPAREWLMHIRAGHMSFEELEAWFKKEQKEMSAAAERSSLPWGPDRVKAEELLIEIQKGH